MTYITFDDADSLDAFTTRGQDEALEIVTAPGSRQNGTACKVHFPGGGHDAGSLRYSFPAEQGVEPESMYATYWLYLDESFQPSYNGKLPGFAGTYGNAGSAGRRSNGTNGWSARGSFYPPDENGNVPIGNYVYHADMDAFGTHAVWDTALEPGNWYVIDQYIELNTPGEHDGILRGWVDKEHVHTSEDWRWRDTADLKIEEWWAHFYHGGSEPAPQDMSLYIDNVYLQDEELPEK